MKLVEKIAFKISQSDISNFSFLKKLNDLVDNFPNAKTLEIWFDKYVFFSNNQKMIKKPFLYKGETKIKIIKFNIYDL